MNDNYLVLDHVTREMKHTLILNNISFSLEKGKIYGFRGKNGSGKTMLFRAICGLIRIDSGKISINGKIIGKDLSFPESVGVLIEYPGFLSQYTGFKNLKMLADLTGKIDGAKIKETIKAVGLDPDDSRKFRKYSLGMKQRLGIAQAVMEEPELILLDEPTNALDEDGVKMLKQLLIQLRDKNKLILVASHDREELDYLCDEIFTVKAGKIVQSEKYSREELE